MKNIYRNLDIATKVYTKVLYSSILEDIDNGLSRNAIVQRLIIEDRFPVSEAKKLINLIYPNQDQTRAAICQIAADIKMEEIKALEEERKAMKDKEERQKAEFRRNAPQTYTSSEVAHGFSHLTHGAATFFHVLSFLFG